MFNCDVIMRSPTPLRYSFQNGEIVPGFRFLPPVTLEELKHTRAHTHIHTDLIVFCSIE